MCVQVVCWNTYDHARFTRHSIWDDF